MRVVLDTNVVVSGLIWGGKPYQLLQAATDGDITLYTSPMLPDELREVLAREHLAARLAKKAPPSSVEQAVGFYGELAVVVSPLATPKASRDPDDDEVLACALAAQADLIVSGDGCSRSGASRGLRSSRRLRQLQELSKRFDRFRAVGVPRQHVGPADYSMPFGPILQKLLQVREEFIFIESLEP